ncbi:MAG TPA: aldehyde dehydrogenase [Ferruginibacter sp.]|nr:aldehyde dehydrogenase [Ferruginibacter sp.]
MIAALQALRDYYDTGTTKAYAFRIAQLKKLKHSIQQHEQEIYTALYTDLKKSPEEVWVTENGLVLAEINHAIKNLQHWMEPERSATNLVNFPSSSFIMKEPLGVVLIIAPWNYPLHLLLNPLIGAIAAGNCAVLKASEYAPATAAVLKKIIEAVFPPGYILFTEGDGAMVVNDLMHHFRFDHIFFTGSTAVGKIIYQKAAEKLVPVTLELGGKSPAIVEADAAVTVAAKRIAIAKFSNAGQICVAPDYVLVHHTQKTALIQALKKSIAAFFTDNPHACYNYGRMINAKHFKRVLQYLQEGNVLHGGRYDEADLYIEPTIIDNVTMNSAVMKEEIFGPVLPIISYTTIQEAKAVIAQNNNPLALYIFSDSAKKEKQWLEDVSFGGGCINNAAWHLTNYHLPFGGRGFSGMGQYHGRASFDIFTHKKSIQKTPVWFDPAIKYPPFKGKLKWFKWIIR